ncbi:MAG TPA: PKHD-type hydroxylase, partial [Xylella fastidiosa subsp. pauca]
KLPAGDLIIHPSTSLHRVAPVTCGMRIASFFWVQSLVRQATHRHQLLELDTAIQSLTASNTDHNTILRLTNIYHNLLREWSET